MYNVYFSVNHKDSQNCWSLYALIKFARPTHFFGSISDQL